MIYWKIAAVFGIISLIGMMYSMLSSDDYDSGWDLANEILRRIGAAFVVGCMWPVCLVIAILMSVATAFEYDE